VWKFIVLTSIHIQPVSYDSRQFGAVPAALVRGRVFFHLWPLSKFGWVHGKKIEPKRELTVAPKEKVEDEIITPEALEEKIMKHIESMKEKEGEKNISPKHTITRIDSGELNEITQKNINLETLSQVEHLPATEK